MRWLYGTAVAGTTFAIIAGAHFSGLNATDPIYGQAAQPVVCVSGCVAQGGSVVVSGTVTANQGTAGSASWLVNVQQWDGTNLGAPSNYGTSPGAVEVPGVNAFVTNTPGVTLPTTPTIAAGNGVVRAPSSESGAGLSSASCSALCSNEVIKSSTGNLHAFNVSADSTLSAAAWWILIFNATSLPANGAVTPVKCYAESANTTSDSKGWNVPVNFVTGITIGVSTTGCFSLTASVHAFISGDYK